MNRTSTRRFPALRWGVFACLFAFLAVSTAAQGLSLVPDPDPRLSAIGAAKGPLAAADLVDAAFIASGVADGDLPSWRAALESALAPLRAEALAKPDAAGRAETMLELLHERGPFRAYSATATTLVDVLDKGLFNCVSSAVVYLVAARELGIPCEGVRTADHAFDSVDVGRPVDVETTTPYGFDPGTKRQFTDAFGKVTGYSYVPPGDYTRRETIDARRLVSLILSNRTSLLESEGRWQEALALAVSYEALEPGAEGRNFVIGRVNNVAADLMRRGEWQSARDIAAQAKARWGEDPRISAISSSAADGALVAAIGAAGGQPRMGFAPALALVDEALSAGDIGLARADEFYVYLYGNEADRIGRDGDWLGAASLAEAGAAKAGGDATLLRAAENFRHNFVATVHNRFAALYNAGRYTEAASVAAEGLAKLPGDATLSADLEAARAAGG